MCIHLTRLRKTLTDIEEDGIKTRNIHGSIGMYGMERKARSLVFCFRPRTSCTSCAFPQNSESAEKESWIHVVLMLWCMS